jgi:chemotaxis protein MotB
MARRKKHEDHLNHEAWAIPYGDLITLLLAFFVVMYAISSVNEGKYRVLSDSMVAAFQGKPMTLEPVQVGEKEEHGPGGPANSPLVGVEAPPRTAISPIPVKTSMEALRQEELSQHQERAAQALTKVADEVERAMDDLVKADMVVVRRKDFWIEVEIRTDILFPSASAQLQPRAVGVIEKLGETLAPFPNAIRVEGHTDNRPIKTLQFFSNWELSAARAGSVVRVLASKGVDPLQLAVIGYGENRPVQTNTTVEGRNANRRVILVILSADVKDPDRKEATDAAVDSGLAEPGDLATPAQTTQNTAPATGTVSAP